MVAPILDRRSIFVALALGVSLLRAVPVLAVDVADFDSLRAYTVRQWERRDGLPASTIISITQSDDGYLWTGTDKGLVRFDGFSFRLFSTETQPALPENVILRVAPATDGGLWLGTMKGLVRFHENQVESFTTAHGLPDDRVVDFVVARDGTLWAATPAGLARSISGRSPLEFAAVGQFADEWITALAEDQDGTIWIGTFASGLSRYQDGRFELIESAPKEIRALYSDERSGLWVGTREQGLFNVRGQAVRRWTTKDGLANDSIYALRGARDGSLWIGTNGGGVNRLRDGDIEALESPSAPAIVRSLFEDSEGNIWAGSYGDGLARITRVAAIVLTAADGLPGDVILPVHHTSSGDLWVGTVSAGAGRFRDGKWVRYDTDDGLPHNGVLTIHTDAEGSVWLGTAGGGLARFRDGSFARYSTEDGLSSDLVGAVLPSRNGGLWIGTGAGVDRMSRGAISHVWSSEHRATALLEGTDGTLWIGTEGSGLVRLEGERAIPIRGAAEKITSLHQSADGAIWAGSQGGGITRWKDGRVARITREHGLLENVVNQIIEDEQGYFWMGGDNGIYRIRRDHLEAAAEKGQPLVQIERFGEGDGLLTPETVGGVFPGGALGSSGRLFIPTPKGLAVLEPEPVRDEWSPVPVIEAVELEGGSLESAGKFALPPRVERFRIRYTAPSFTDPENTYFRYRLEGFEDEWVEAGNRRVAEYTRLPPGLYTFRVSARSGPGAWSDAGASTELEIRAAFFETTVFRILVAAALLLLAFLLHRWLTGALRRRHDELLQLVVDRERAEASLRASEQHFRALIENASDMVMIVNVEGLIEYVSPSVDQILRRTADEVEGRDLRSIVDPEDVPAIEKMLLHEALAGKTVTVIVRVPLWNRPDRHLELVAQRFDLESDSERLLINCRDVTQREMLERRLERANRIASLGNLAATVSHEFNNVLMGIRLMGESVLRRGSVDAAGRGAIEKVIEYADRGKRISESILQFSRSADPQITSLPLGAWPDQMSAELRQILGASIQLEVIVDEPDMQMAADPQQIMQVFTNLTLNARHAMQGSGRMTIRFSRASETDVVTLGFPPDQFVHVIVEDSGPGIPPDVLPHIFEPLFTTKRTEGTGLGLAIVYQIMAKHGGHIAVSSEEGKGTAFHMFLPATPVLEASAAAEPATGPLFEVGSEISILLVEDDPLVAEGLVTTLSDLGCRVRCAATGGKAIALIGAERFDAVVLDVGLPDMDGTAVFQEIERLRPGLPVVFSTGHADVDTPGEYLALPHVEFLRKPYDTALLLAKIQLLVASTSPFAE